MRSDIKSTSAEGILTLLQIPGVGPQKAQSLAERFETLGEVRRTSSGSNTSSSQYSPAGDLHVWEVANERARRILDASDRLSIRPLTAADSDYPIWLRRVIDRPPVIFLKGSLPRGPRYVACVGTREPSAFGETVSDRLSSYLASEGWSIVSGLALGVDAIAHRAALKERAHTVAVLANGLDTVYPKKNLALAEEILASGGAWLSEQPLGAPPIPRNLVSRDRIQSGMSAGTIVMQTDVVGGSMHTVRFTLLQRRLLFAPVPSGKHAEEPKSRGLLALTQMKGPSLCELLDAQGEFKELLVREYREKAPAFPLRNSGDYPKLLRMLDEFSSHQAALTARAPSPQPGLL